MELGGKNIAVTGATGFLGRYVVDVLLRRGAHVIGVVRNPNRVPELAARGVEFRQADLVERERLTEVFRGVDAVVSNAALYSLRGLLSFGTRNLDEHQRINIEGTRNVFEAVATARVRRVVHVSSVAVYSSRWQRRITEDHPQVSAHTRGTGVNAYALSKAVSEQLAWRLAAQYDLQVTTMRPGAIYGAFDPNFMPVVRRLLKSRVTVYPVLARIALVYAGDVAEAIALALERAIAIGKAYNVTGDGHTLWQFARAWKEAGGKGPRCMIPVPIPVRQSFDHSRATRELGWHNRSLVEGLRETMALEGSTPKW